MNVWIYDLLLDTLLHESKDTSPGNHSKSKLSLKCLFDDRLIDFC